MNALELAEIQAFKTEELTMWERNHTASMLRQQQVVIEDLEKENTDLRYLIATKLEQQNGISLNSMAHPITNTPEPSYEIDLDKLETIEIDLPSPEPVAWMLADKEAEHIRSIMAVQHDFVPEGCVEIALYTHPVKEQLTDEEIIKVYENMLGVASARGSAIEFARAILLKAQEK